jgi:predicted RNA-binding Zn-ribbon protein involved in translation (DUF1610 family)
MDDRRSVGVQVAACSNCGLQVPVTTAIVHMGAADLFACPGCSHQEIWRDPFGVSQKTNALSRRGAL